ncbi:MAG: MBL fold metallo-hydrolase [Methyloversatilis sp. 12-65-5]|nr:MAG: MBL fold metallo-hydrolase [Methyloversatilis sp. 12-65-5]
MYFHPIEDPDAGRIGYLVADAGSQDAVIIDPPPRSAELLLALRAERRLRLSHVLRTHVHASQPLNCSALSELTGATLVIADCVGINAACPAKVERAVHGSTMVLGQEVLCALATPGHTAHCVSYLWRDRLFRGDAFDLGSCADGDDDGDPGLLYDGLTCRLFKLPEQTLVFPAHPLRGRRVTFITDMTSRRAAHLRHARPSPRGEAVLKPHPSQSSTPETYS